MNVITAVQDYVNKMLSLIPGMKVIVLDKETAGIVSMVYSKSQILQKEVYLFERIDMGTRENMPHLKAVCLLRPTPDNFRFLEDELKSPKYGEYHLFFTNTIKSENLDELASADEHEVVNQVQEFFADYYAINRELFSLNQDSVISADPNIHRMNVDRICDGLAACLLSLKKRPVIRYQKNSQLAQNVAQELQRRITREKLLFDFRMQSQPLLLIVDRCNDPVTPLLSQWTYQAMVHELIGIQNNRVDLRHIPGVKKEYEEIVLSTEQDPFFLKNIYSNFGDLALAVKEDIDQLQQHTKSNQNINSIADMKRFVENYPEFKKLSSNVSKHVTLLDELSRAIDRRSLMDVSELEQDLACKDDHSNHYRRLMAFIQNPRIGSEDKLRLTMLYALRYQTNTSSKITEVTNALCENGLSRESVSLIDALIRYGGEKSRVGDLFWNKDLLTSWTKTLRSGMQGATNIYTQHKPYIMEILEQILKNQLKEVDYPSLTTISSKERPQEIIVFIVGGATYEEALHVAQLNASNNSVRVVLGGTTVHNSSSFLKEITQLRNFSSGIAGLPH